MKRRLHLALLIAWLAPGPAGAVCSITNPVPNEDLTSLIVAGAITGSPKTITMKGGCTNPFFVAVSAAQSTNPASSASGYDGFIAYTVEVAHGVAKATVTASSATPLKTVSARQAKGVAKPANANVTITITPIAGHKLVSGLYGGQFTVSVCETAQAC